MITEAVRRALDVAGVRPRRVRDAIVLLGTGYAADAYLVRAAEGDRVLRLPKAPIDHNVRLLRRETRLLQLLERLDLGVQTPREARDVLEGETFLGTLHVHVPGGPLPRGLRGAARTRLCDEIGRFLARLHAVPRADAAETGVREVDLWPELYQKLIEMARPRLSAAAAAWLVTTGEEFARRGGTTGAPRVMVHGDLQPAHLLADAGGVLVGAIDFGEAMIADPALDFAGVLNHLGWRDLERVWTAYRAAGGQVDADAARRTRFYIATAPIYRVLFGEAALGPAERRAGQRQFAARAAAALRA